MNLTLLQKPTFHPVDLDELALFLRIEEHDDMPLIVSLLETAISKAETITGIKFAQQQWRLDLDGFDREITLPNPPLITLDSIEYYDTLNVLNTLTSEYELLKENDVSFIKEAYGYTFPSTYPRKDAVQITFTCGYASQDLIPEGIKSAIKSIVWHMYDDKGSKLTDEFFRFALSPYILRGFY